jgi:RimJ/RimL family protein N-acetyltransferase
MRFIPGGALSDERAVEALLARYAQEQTERGFSSWAVVERVTGRAIGDVGFGVFGPTGDVELGYTLARDRWELGFAVEAAGACLRAGLANLDMDRIIAVVDAENERSLIVAGRIGMAREGVLEAHGRPHVLFVARQGSRGDGAVR